MATELTHIGFGNMLAMNRVIAIVSPNSAPIKRMMKEKKDAGALIDMTNGRRTKAVIMIDNGFIVLSAIAGTTIAGRVAASRSNAPLDPDEYAGEEDNVAA